MIAQVEVPHKPSCPLVFVLKQEAVLRSLPLTRLRRSTLFVDVLSVKLFPKMLFLSVLPPEVGQRAAV